MEYPPQDGEVWMNIHTSIKVTIHAIEEGRVGKVVAYLRDGVVNHCDIPKFQANWKRFKTGSKWHIGAIGKFLK